MILTPRASPAGARVERQAARPGAAAASAWPLHRRVRSHCRFRNRGTEDVSKSGTKRMGGGTTRQCGRALLHRAGRISVCRRSMSRRPGQRGRGGVCRRSPRWAPALSTGLITQEVLGVPRDPLPPRRGPLGSPPDRDSAISKTLQLYQQRQDFWLLD
jgi:hypothetical protein